jgi:purine-binding chemotaxis protein CheW
MTEQTTQETCQYLTFKLADEVFALDVAKVREILEYAKITKVPKTADFLLGVINVRGSVVPVIDMRLRLGLPSATPTVDTCIVVLEIGIDGEMVIAGALVDSVQEVFELESHMIEPAPRIGTRWKTEFIDGLGKRDDSFIMILNIEKLISSQETAFMSELDAAVSQAPSSPEIGDDRGAAGAP